MDIRDTSLKVIERMSSWDKSNAMAGDTGTIEFLAMVVTGQDTTSVPSVTPDMAANMAAIVADVVSILRPHDLRKGSNR